MDVRVAKMERKEMIVEFAYFVPCCPSLMCHFVRDPPCLCFSPYVKTHQSTSAHFSYIIFLVVVMGKLLQFLLLCWVATVASAAFAPKKRAFKRQQQDQNPSLIQQQAAIAAAAAAYCSEQECYPPPFAFAQAAASMAPAEQHHHNHHAHQDWDDDMVVGYGTGIVACVVSLALGLTLGYVGN